MKVLYKTSYFFLLYRLLPFFNEKSEEFEVALEEPEKDTDEPEEQTVESSGRH